MKRVFYFFSGLLFLNLCIACSDDDGTNVPPPAPSKGEEAVQEVIEVLEQNEDVSDFVEILKETDVADVTTERLTVFAVRNAMPMRSIAGLDSVSIRRHIAEGNYRKDELTDGMTLTSISGDNLYINRHGDQVYVNGVLIEGDEVAAGNSYIYTVPQVIEQQNAPVEFYKTTIRVVDLTNGPVEMTGLENVTVKINDYATGDTLGTWHTDDEGLVEVQHMGSITYTLFKEGYTYEQDGFLFYPTADGGISYTDLNGDGRVDDNDRVTVPYLFPIYYGEGETEKNVTIYMMSEAVVDIPDEGEIAAEWSALMNHYVKEHNALEAQLVTGYTGFTYADVWNVSETYWDLAYNTLESGRYYIDLLHSQQLTATDTYYSILTDVALIRTQLAGCYGQLVYDGQAVPFDQLTADLMNLADIAPGNQRYAAYLLLAKTYLCTESWMQAVEYAQRVADGGFKLTEDPWTVGEEEIIWGHYAGAAVMGDDEAHPLIYREALLIQALGTHKVGNDMDAVMQLNVLNVYYGMEPVMQLNPDNAFTLTIYSLQGTGQLYPYARFWECPIAVDGFSPTNYLLPIPQKAIDEYGLTQNPGY